MSLQQNLNRLMDATASELKDICEEHNTKINKQDLKATITMATLNYIKGNKVTASSNTRLEYNTAGDLLAIAHGQFMAGKTKHALETVASAFAAEDCQELMNIIIQANEEATSSTDDKDADDTDTDDTDTDDKDDDTDDDSDNEEDQDDDKDALNTPIHKKANRSDVATQADIDAKAENAAVTASTNGDDDDDSEDSDLDDSDDDNADSDDSDLDDNDDDTDDDNSDDDTDDNDDDTDDSDDSDNSDDDTDDDSDNEEDTEHKAMANVLEQLKNNPEIIAQANVMSRSGQQNARQKARTFLVKSAAMLK